MKRYVLLILFLVLILFQLFQIVNLNKNVTDLYSLSWAFIQGYSTRCAEWR